MISSKFLSLWSYCLGRIRCFLDVPKYSAVWALGTAKSLGLIFVQAMMHLHLF